MTTTSSKATSGSISIRPMTPADAAASAQICFEAFRDVQDRHNFPRDFPVPEAAAGLFGAWAGQPSIFGVVAEVDGRIVGSNFLHEHDPVRGIGPASVSPDVQNANTGVGRKLMEAVIERGRGSASVRLVQDAFNMRSLALYDSLGFELKEPLALMGGKASGGLDGGVEVRRLEERDLPECEALCKKVHGFERTNELRGALQAFQPYVAVRGGRVTAYASSVTFWPLNHGVAERDEDLQAVLRGASAAASEPVTFLAPLRSPLFRWARREGFRLLKPMNLMALSGYQEPRGPWFPNVLY
jgi:predicted N-acetyltransferase YhbS